MTAFAALAATLEQLAHAIRPLSADEYDAREWRCSGSIGAHVRHCLDHVLAFERALVTGTVCYDHRERNTLLERDPQLAHARLRRAVARLGSYGDDLLERRLLLTAQLTADGASVQVATTVGRELAFIVSHTIHHSALVAVLLEHASGEAPPRLGLAPTTPELVCAR